MENTKSELLNPKSRFSNLKNEDPRFTGQIRNSNTPTFLPLQRGGLRRGSFDIGVLILFRMWRVLWLFSLVLTVQCAYFNTFYNAQKYFRQGKKLVVHDTLKVISSEPFDKTIEKTTAVIIKYPDSRYVDDALFMMGASYYYKGDYRRALEKLDFVVLNYTDSKFHDDALYYKGLAHYQQEKFAQAIIALKQTEKSNQYRVKAMIALCYVYFKDHNYLTLTEVATNLLKEGIDKKEKRWVLHLLGEAQFKQEFYEDALVTFQELLFITRVKKDKREITLKIAETYLEMGEYDRCQEFLRGQADVEFKSILADLNVKLGNIAKAKELYFDIAINSNFDFSSEMFYKLAELYKTDDSLEQAIAYYDSSVNRARASEYGIKSKKMADILSKVDIYSKETENIDHAQFLLAEIYFVDFENPERAVTEYVKVYTDFPQSEWAPKAMYAQFWIAKDIFKNDSLAQSLARDLLKRYPNSEYAQSASIFLPQHEDDEGWLEE
jgi:TolA-binding protein